MVDLQQLIKNIELWAEDRNLIEGSTPQKQFIKLMEEFGELCSGVSKNKPDVVKDSIGDCFVVMVILAAQRGKNEALVAEELILESHSFKSEIEDSLLDTFRCFAHLAEALTESDEEKSVGLLFEFCFTGLLEAANYFDLDFKTCVQSAWEEIKDRKGKMIDGVFVKEGDL
ncbi:MULTISPECIES: MazG-like family protein [unclassified Pasteurella]|uniref:MazG-like family protein n=1 Tax=unclassified Pasteurella TaxID=2621516 RepID=UPI0010747A40|nr:MazG-like family protein [Pasteurella sp. 19428wF3_WM03]TFU50649.1 pyrophosphatase [Pasteurella sp. WM03]